MSAPLVLVVNGPKLNTLGKRQPEIYGSTTLAEIEETLRKRAAELEIEVEFFQSDLLEELIEALKSARGRASAIVLNPAAFTHYALALRDAVEETGLPLYEVHLSNIYARESFRRHSVISPVAAGVVCGLGPAGYVAALEAAARQLKGK